MGDVNLPDDLQAKFDDELSATLIEWARQLIDTEASLAYDEGWTEGNSHGYADGFMDGEASRVAAEHVFKRLPLVHCQSPQRVSSVDDSTVDDVRDEVREFLDLVLEVA